MENKRLSAKQFPTTEDEKRYIRNCYTSVSVPTMAKILNRYTSFVYEFMREENLIPYDSVKANAKLKNQPVNGIFNEREKENWLI